MALKRPRLTVACDVEITERSFSFYGVRMEHTHGVSSAGHYLVVIKRRITALRQGIADVSTLEQDIWNFLLAAFERDAEEDLHEHATEAVRVVEGTLDVVPQARQSQFSELLGSLRRLVRKCPVPAYV